MSERVETLRTAIETRYKCKAVHEKSTVVMEKFKNERLWVGVVESFALTGHPKAKRCYGWSFHDGKKDQYLNALEIPPVVSPQTAVSSSIVARKK
jgi:hypothetical protein